MAILVICVSFGLPRTIGDTFIRGATIRDNTVLVFRELQGKIYQSSKFNTCGMCRKNMSVKIFVAVTVPLILLLV